MPRLRLARRARRYSARPVACQQQEHAAESDLPPDGRVRPRRALEPPVAVAQVPADQPGDEEEQSAKADREDALILPARVPWPGTALCLYADDHDSEDQPDQGGDLDVHG